MEQTLQYFKQAERLLDTNEFTDEEEYSVFIQNVLTEVEGLEYRLSCNHDGSIILEKILKAATGFQLRVFFERIREKLLNMCCHRYASHVVETWLSQAVSMTDEIGDDQKGPPHLKDQLGDISHLMIESFVQLAEDEYGTHVLRLLIKLWNNRLNEARIKFANGPEHLRGLAHHLLSLPKGTFDIKRAILSKHMSAVLQILIICLPKEEQRKLHTLVLPKLYSEEKIKNGSLMSICDHQIGSRFIESFIETLDAGDFLLFLNKAIRPNFADLMAGQYSNFTVQCLITRCHNFAQFGMILELIRPNASDLISKQRYGILTRLVQWVVEHDLLMADATMEIVFEAFRLKIHQDSKRSFKAISSLMLDKENDHSIQPQTIGCQILQNAVYFPANCVKPLIDSFLDLSIADLLVLSCHSNGSRVVEAVLSSKTVSISVKHRTIRKLRHHVDSLAIDRCGSHVVDQCYRAASPDLREKIVEHLAASKSRLQDNQYGRLVLRNCRILEFEQDQANWRSAQDAADRKKAMFADILDDTKDTLLPESLKVNPKALNPKKKKADHSDLTFDSRPKKPKKANSKIE